MFSSSASCLRLVDHGVGFPLANPADGSRAYFANGLTAFSTCTSRLRRVCLGCCGAFGGLCFLGRAWYHARPKGFGRALGRHTLVAASPFLLRFSLLLGAFWLQSAALLLRLPRQLHWLRFTLVYIILLLLRVVQRLFVAWLPERSYCLPRVQFVRLVVGQVLCGMFLFVVHSWTLSVTSATSSDSPVLVHIVVYILLRCRLYFMFSGVLLRGLLDVPYCTRL